MLKFKCISDLHGCFPSVDSLGLKGVDLFLFAGDYQSNNQGDYAETVKFIQWLNKVKRHVRATIVVPGNHDFFCYNHQEDADQMFAESGHILLVDNGVTIDGVRIWGTPWSPQFMNWAYMDSEHNLTQRYRPMVQYAPDIIVSHTPMLHCLDVFFENGQYKSVGSSALRTAVEHSKRTQYLVCGHIHGSRGYTARGMGDRILNVVNGAYLMDNYEKWPYYSHPTFEVQGDDHVGRS